MEIICVANQKGGIGKTTTATAIASVLHEKGEKVLLIDTDPQCNSTDTYQAKVAHTDTLYDVILNKDNPSTLTEAIQHTDCGDIVASDPALKNADVCLQNDAGALYALKEALSELSGYDYVIFDTAPADNVLLKNCLVAATKVVIPITTDRYAIQGLADLNKTINTIIRYQNPTLSIAGLLLIKYKKNQILAKEVKEALNHVATQMKTKVFDTTISESVNVQKAQAQRTSLIKYAPKSTTAIDYIKFVDELTK